MAGINGASVILIGIFLALSGWLYWWLFASPIPQPGQPAASLKLPVFGMETLWLGVACALQWLGSLVAASEASVGSTASDSIGLAWLAHGLQYAGLTILVAVGLTSVRSLSGAARASGAADIRISVRRDPRRGWTAFAAAGAVAAVVIDLSWHLAGQDGEAAHWLMGLAATGAGLIAASSHAWHQGKGDRRGSLIWLTLTAVAFNSVYSLLLQTWEVPSASVVSTSAAPLWLYPAVGGGLALVGLLLVKKQLSWRWSATAAAFFYFGVRLLATILLALMQPAAPLPDLPLVFVGGALAMDWLPWAELSSRWQRLAGLTGIFTAGYLVIALPALGARVDLPQLGTGDIALASMGTFILCGLLAYLAPWEST